MIIFVGSENPVKINSVVIAASERWPDIKAKGFSVSSGVSDQPMTDEETKLGSINRAKFALDRGLLSNDKDFDLSQTPILGMGLEGGVFVEESEKEKKLWATVWVTVIDQKGNTVSVNGARFEVPKPIADRIFAGEEMGHAMANIMGDMDLNQRKQSGGMIGIITKNIVDRTEEYTNLAKLALGLWFGKNWYKEISDI